MEHLERQFEGPGFAIAYIHCNYWLQQEQKRRDLLSSLSKQSVLEQVAVHCSVETFTTAT
jgi:hypothetical protein